MFLCKSSMYLQKLILDFLTLPTFLRIKSGFCVTERLKPSTSESNYSFIFFICLAISSESAIFGVLAESLALLARLCATFAAIFAFERLTVGKLVVLLPYSKSFYSLSFSVLFERLFYYLISSSSLSVSSSSNSSNLFIFNPMRSFSSIY